MFAKVLALCVVTVVAADRFMTACPISCQNGGSCIQSDDGKYRCLCAQNYVGETCSLHVPGACDSYPCQNGYTCTPLGNDDYTCGCPESMGKNCEKAIVKRQGACTGVTCPPKTGCILQSLYCKYPPCPVEAVCIHI